jgi:hypothetical protein
MNLHRQPVVAIKDLDQQRKACAGAAGRFLPQEISAQLLIGFGQRLAAQ